MIRNYDMKYYEDRYNVNRTRTPKNVERWQVNCAGRALGTENWYCCYETEEDGERLVDCNAWDDEEYDFNARAEEMAEFMLNDIPGLRRVDSPHITLEPNERLIGFKVGWGPGDSGDFHFIYKSPRGFWMHKPGGNYTRRMSKREALGQTWCDGAYESDTIWMVRKFKK